MKTSKLKLLYLLTRVKLFFSKKIPSLWSDEYIDRKFFSICSFSGECNFCDDPKGVSFADMSGGEGWMETNFYVCKKCAPYVGIERQLEGIHQDLIAAKHINDVWTKNNIK